MSLLWKKTALSATLTRILDFRTHYSQKPPTLNFGKKPEIAKNKENRHFQAVFGHSKVKKRKKKKMKISKNSKNTEIPKI